MATLRPTIESLASAQAHIYWAFLFSPSADGVEVCG